MQKLQVRKVWDPRDPMGTLGCWDPSCNQYYPSCKIVNQYYYGTEPFLKVFSVQNLLEGTPPSQVRKRRRERWQIRGDVLFMGSFKSILQKKEREIDVVYCLNAAHPRVCVFMLRGRQCVCRQSNNVFHLPSLLLHYYMLAVFHMPTAAAATPHLPNCTRWKCSDKNIRVCCCCSNPVSLLSSLFTLPFFSSHIHLYYYSLLSGKMHLFVLLLLVCGVTEPEHGNNVRFDERFVANLGPLE